MANYAEQLQFFFRILGVFVAKLFELYITSVKNIP